MTSVDERPIVRPFTVDTIVRSDLQLAQPVRGYRFNIDAVLLAHYAMTHVRSVPQSVVDLGSGCGVVGLLLAMQWPQTEVRLVELQPELASLARANVERNGLAQRVQVIDGDLRDRSRWELPVTTRTLYVANPPFFPVASGPPSPDPMVAVAKHELQCTLAQLVETLAGAMGYDDDVVLIHTARRRAELMRELTRVGLSAVSVRDVVPFPGRPAQRVLVGVRAAEAMVGRREPSSGSDSVSVDKASPLVVHSRPGVYSAELRSFLGD